jgi:hypothetical protein
VCGAHSCDLCVQRLLSPSAAKLDEYDALLDDLGASDATTFLDTEVGAHDPHAQSQRLAVSPPVYRWGGLSDRGTLTMPDNGHLYNDCRCWMG